MTFQPKPVPTNWQTSDPDELRRTLNRLSDTLVDTNRQIAASFTERTEALSSGGVATLTTGQYQAQFGKALRIGCPTGSTARIVLPAAQPADAFRDVHLVRTSVGGTLTIVSSGGGSMGGGITLLSMPNVVGMYTVTFDGLSFYRRREL